MPVASGVLVGGAITYQAPWPKVGPNRSHCMEGLIAFVSLVVLSGQISKCQSFKKKVAKWNGILKMRGMIF